MLSNVETSYRTPYYSDATGMRGKSVVIVGDGGSVEQATAALLVERGAKVFIAARSAVELTAAFTALAETGGEWSGMVANLDDPAAVQHFFDQAIARLGRIDALINYLIPPIPVTGGQGGAPRNLHIQEAIRRMQSRGQGHIINVNLTGAGAGAGAGARMQAVLRKEAREHGIQVTLIEPGEKALREPVLPGMNIDPEEVAQCIYDSLVQPYPVDLVYLNGQVRKQKH